MMDDGRLLQFSIDVLYAELLKQALVEDVHNCKDEIDAALEQCFYCLYGHPHKRAKAKHLEDHSANPVIDLWLYSQVAQPTHFFYVHFVYSFVIIIIVAL